MKTANVLTAKKQALNNNAPAILKKVSINQTMSPLRRTKAEGGISIQGYELKQWLEHLSGPEGVYFLDGDHGKHSLHFKHHGTGQLMELEQQVADDREYLKALLFDLSLFPEAPILAFDASMVANELYAMAAIYYEHAKEIDKVVGRMVELDMKSLFAKGIYHEPRVNCLSIDGIYQAFFPGTSRSFKEQGSYAMHLVYLAIQNIFNQVLAIK